MYWTVSCIFISSFSDIDLLFLLTRKNIGSVSWVHHLLRSVRCYDCWFKRYVMAYMLFYYPFFNNVTLVLFLSSWYRLSSSYLQMATSYTSIHGFPQKHTCLYELCLHSFGSKLLLRRVHGTSLSLARSFSCCAYTLLMRWFFGQVLSLHETLASYGSVYYIGTVIPVTLIVLGSFIKPAPVRSKARKDQWVQNAWSFLWVFLNNSKMSVGEEACCVFFPLDILNI